MKFTFRIFCFVKLVLLLAIGHSTAAVLNLTFEFIRPKLEISWMDLTSSGWVVFGQGVHRNPGVKFSREGRIIVSPRVSKLLIKCTANYPVHWEYDIPEEISYNDYKIEVRTHRTSKDFEKQLSYKFYSYLSLSGDGRGITGNYTCTSANDATLRINHYIFWEDSVRDLIYGHKIDRFLTITGKPQPCNMFSCPDKPTKTAMADKDNQTLTLPCTVCKPEIPIKLFKRHLTTTSEYDEEVTLNSSISFDPARGFTLKIQELPSPFGIYKCVLNFTQGGGGFFRTRSDEVLLVNATNEITKPWSDVANNTIAGKSTYYFDGDTGRITCCSDGEQPPKIYVQKCATRFYCRKVKRQLRKFEYFDHSGVSSGNCVSSNIKRFGKSGAFRCTGNGIDVIREYYIPFRQDDYDGSERNKSEIYYDDEISNVPKEHFIAFSTNHGEVNVTVGVAVVYSNLSLQIECRPSTYIFADGIRWTIIFKNQTEQLLPVSQKSERLDNLDLDNFDINIESANDVQSVVCHAPLHGSFEWVNATLKLEVVEPVRPTIDGAIVERLTWNEGDLEKELTCQAHGNPLPKMTWIPHDHQESVQMLTRSTSFFNFLASDYESNEVESMTKHPMNEVEEETEDYSNREIISDGEALSKLTFQKVFRTMTANYTCLAISLVGRTTKTFEVTVKGRNRSVMEEEVNEVLTKILTQDDVILNGTDIEFGDNATNNAKSSPVIDIDTSPSDNNSSVIIWSLIVIICCGIIVGAAIFWTRKKRRQNRMGDAQSVRSFQAMVQSDSYENVS